MDANGKEVPEEQAERTIIAEYDDDGNRIKEFYLSNTPPMTPEEAKAYWDSIVVDPNSELIKKQEVHLFKRIEVLKKYIMIT